MDLDAILERLALARQRDPGITDADADAYVRRETRGRFQSAAEAQAAATPDIRSVDATRLLSDAALARQRDPRITSEDVDAFIREETGGRYTTAQDLQRVVARETHGERAMTREPDGTLRTAEGNVAGAPVRGESVSGAQAFMTGLGQGATGGFSDELAGAVGALPRLLPGGESYGDARRRLTEEQREFIGRARDERPRATLVGDLAGGALVPGLGTGAAAARGAGIGGKVLRGALAGAGSGAAAGAGYADGDLGARARGAAAGGAVGLGAGAVLPLLLNAKPIARGVGRWAANRPLVREINEELSRPARVPPVRGLQSAADHVLQPGETARRALLDFQPSQEFTAPQGPRPMTEVPLQPSSSTGRRGTTRPSQRELEVRAEHGWSTTLERGPRGGALVGSRASRDAGIALDAARARNPNTPVPGFGRPVHALSDAELARAVNEARLSDSPDTATWLERLSAELRRRLEGVPTTGTRP